MKYRESFVAVNGAAQGFKIKHMLKYFARPGPTLTKIKLLYFSVCLTVYVETVKLLASDYSCKRNTTSDIKS